MRFPLPPATPRGLRPTTATTGSPFPLRASRWSVSVLAIAAAGITLSACVHAPRPTPDTRLPAAYAAPAGAALPAEALDHWWTGFDDQQLTRLIETALAKAPDARSAQTVLDEARANRRGQIRQLYIPSTPLKSSASRKHTKILDASGGTSLTQGGDTDTASTSFDVSWELDLWGRRRAARQVVDNDWAAARFAYEGSRTALAASVAESYVQAKSLAVQLDDARQAARVNAALADLSAGRAKAGLAATSEADRAEADQAQSLAQVENLQAQLAVARRTLLILVGRGADPLDSLPIEPTLGAAPAIPSGVPGELLGRRPDVREALARFSSATGQLGVDELDLLPTFTLTPGLGWSKTVSPGYRFLGQTGNTSITTGTWTLGGGVSLPVLNSPALLAQIDAQSARTRKAAVAYEKAVQTAFGEAENAMAQLAAAQRRIDLLDAGEARAARAYAASRTGYSQGLSDLTATLQAEQTWRGARTALTSARSDALLQTIKTYKALGGGWSAGLDAPRPSAK